MRETWARLTPALTVDPPAATHAVATLPGSPVVLRVTPLAGGLANTCLRLDFADGRAPAVLRIYQRDPDAARREAALHRLAASLGLPVPQVLLEIPAAIGLGGPALLLQHVAGTRGDLALSAMDDAGAAAIGRQLGGLLARLHAVQPGPVGLLGPDLRVATPLSDADAGLAGFVDRCITHGRGAARLGPALTSGLRAMIAAEAGRLGLEVHAGHGIDFETVKPIAAIPQVVELNIGHFLIGEAIFIGLPAAITQMRALMDHVRGEKAA